MVWYNQYVFCLLGEKIMNILILTSGFGLTYGLIAKCGNFLGFFEKARRIYTLREEAFLNDYKHDK